MANPVHFFSPIMYPSSDNLNRVQNAVRAAFDLLADQVKRFIDSSASATKAAVWSTVAVNTHNDMRRIAGDQDAKAGPRALIVTGRTTYFDGGQGVYGWDPSSTAADDDVNFIVGAKPTGRWRKV